MRLFSDAPIQTWERGGKAEMKPELMEGMALNEDGAEKC